MMVAILEELLLETDIIMVVPIELKQLAVLGEDLAILMELELLSTSIRELDQSMMVLVE